MVIIRGFVLAGGASARMGQVKALVAYPGAKPMVTTVVEALQPMCGTVHVVLKPGQRDQAWPDSVAYLYEQPGLPPHPLAGVVTALAQLGRGEWALMAPCDVPFLDPVQLRRMIHMGRSTGAGAIAHDGDSAHPLICFLPATALTRARSHLMEGRSVKEFAALFGTVSMTKDSLRNVNAPEDMKS